MTMLDTPDGVRFAQYAAIACGLRLQVRSGLKHSHNAPPLAARRILTEAGRKAPRNTAKLLEAFEAYRRDLWPALLASKPA